MIGQVTDAAEERDLHTAADLDLRWLQGDGPALEEAVRAVGRPEGRGYVWVAGETDAVAPLRGYFRHELGLPAVRYDVDGYVAVRTVSGRYGRAEAAVRDLAGEGYRWVRRAVRLDFDLARTYSSTSRRSSTRARSSAVERV